MMRIAGMVLHGVLCLTWVGIAFGMVHAASPERANMIALAAFSWLVGTGSYGAMIRMHRSR